MFLWKNSKQAGLTKIHSLTRVSSLPKFFKLFVSDETQIEFRKHINDL